MGFKAYLEDIWNTVNLLSFCLNIFVLVTHITGYSQEFARLGASLAMIITWV